MFHVSSCKTLDTEEDESSDKESTFKDGDKHSGNVTVRLDDWISFAFESMAVRSYLNVAQL